MTKLHREDCASLKGFIEENWEQFIGWMVMNHGIPYEDAEEDVERIVAHLEEGAK